MALNDKAEKFFVIVKHGDKESKKELPSEEKALDFVKQARLLQKQNPKVRIYLRVSFDDSNLYALHSGEILRDKDGRVLQNTRGIPMRKMNRMPQKKGELYCPECGFYNKFSLDSFLGTKRCDCCGISTNDFDVKTTNGLWETIKKS